MEDYVSFEQALKLKELGFDWECNHNYKKDFYNKWIFFHCLQDAYGNHNHGIKSEPIFVSAPTLSQAAKWLREVKGISVEPFSVVTRKKWAYHLCHSIGEDFGITIHIDKKDLKGYGFNTYEKALSAGIDKTLELLK